MSALTLARQDTRHLQRALHQPKPCLLYGDP